MNTVIVAVSSPATSFAVTVAVNAVLLTNMVGRSTPSQRTTEPEKKFCPVTLRTNPVEPAEALSGFIEVIDGTGNETSPTPEKPRRCGLLGVLSSIVKFPVRLP